MNTSHEFALLIIDGAGHVREWTRGTRRDVREFSIQLPANGWTFYAIVPV